MTDDLKAQIDAIPDGARVRWTCEATLGPLMRIYLRDLARHAPYDLVSVEEVTPSDDEVCASLLPDERITFHCDGASFSHWTFYDDNDQLCAGPFVIRWADGPRVDDITNIRRVQP